MEPREVLARIEKGLRAPLPGVPAQLAMAPEPRPGHRPCFEVEDTCRKAGVLVLLYPRDGRLRVLLTRRAESVLHHRGQISLPGGERHPGESLEAAALRETSEELGIDLGSVRVLGKLTPLYIPPSNYCVYPAVAHGDAPLEFRPQPGEVAEVLEPPVGHLADPVNVRRETRRYGGQDHVVPFYDFEGHKIWGATAMVLAEFLALL
ncbi:MAG TPA: CoA pyrophosphatase [Candidatus Aminicenantes bacterium]|nr:CoA pyrophosphatase [Candidatus Aminicenantes bacterium]